MLGAMLYYLKKLMWAFAGCLAHMGLITFRSQMYKPKYMYCMQQTFKTGLSIL